MSVCPVVLRLLLLFGKKLLLPFVAFIPVIFSAQQITDESKIFFFESLD